MKTQILVKSFYLFLTFILLIILVFVLTSIYFDLNYLISPTFKIIKWTGLNIILIHIIYMLILGYLIFKNKLKKNILFYSSLINLFLSLTTFIYSSIYFYDFLKF